MRYSVDVGGDSFQVEFRKGPRGLEVSLGNGTWRPARLVPAPGLLHCLELGRERHSIIIDDDPLDPGASYALQVPGSFPVRVRPQDTRTLSAAAGRQASQASGPRLQRSAMPGVIVEVRVAAGDAVERGDVLLVLEAMKMQNEIKAEGAGKVHAVHVRPGETVPAGAKLVEFVAEANAT